MKTTHTPDEVRQFLQTAEHANPDSIEPLAEGHISQALGFETVDGEKYVLRISAKDDDFLADRFAFERFGDQLPIPRVTEIGRFGEDSYYCITERIEGEPSNKLSEQQMAAALGSIEDAFAKIFMSDISSSHGYGEVDIQTGDAPSRTWRAALEGFRLKLADGEDGTKFDNLRGHAKNIGLNPSLVEDFLVQFADNLPFASEVRRLFHGDYGFDNLLIRENKVVAVIDWAQMGYGDWMRDFARLDFWWPGRHGDADSFAKKYGLDRDHLPERQALYWAVNALATIEFADKHKSTAIANWLRKYIADKRMQKPH